MRAGCTTRPRATFSMRTRIASVARNDSGIDEAPVRAVVERALEALHAVRLVRVRLERARRSARATRSARERIGLRLYAIADEPICSVSNGSSISPNACSMRMSPRTSPRSRRCPPTTPSTCASSLRVYVWPVTGIERAKPDRRGHAPVELAHLRVVAVEELEEGRLRARRALHAAAGQRRDAVVEVREVEHEVLHPERRALADGRRLRGLEVRVAERRLVAPLRARTPRARAARDRRVPRSSSRPRRMRIRSALSVTYALVAPRWMNGFARRARRRRTRARAPSRRGGSGARTPRPRRSRCRRGARASARSPRPESARPSSCSASASASQSCRQSPCRVCGDHSSSIALRGVALGERGRVAVVRRVIESRSPSW